MPVSALAWPEYERRYAAVHHRILTARPMDEAPFADPEWTPLLLPGGLGLEPDLMLALRGAAAEAGDAECVMLDRFRAFPDEPARRVGFDAADWEQVRTGTVLGHVEAEVFAASGAWALITSPEGFGLFGGTRMVVDGFLGRVPGGLGGLRPRARRDRIRPLFLWRGGEGVHALPPPHHRLGLSQGADTGGAESLRSPCSPCVSLIFFSIRQRASSA